MRVAAGRGPRGGLEPMTLRQVRGSRPAHVSVAGVLLVAAAWATLVALSIAGLHQRTSHDVIFGHHGAHSPTWSLSAGYGP